MIESRKKSRIRYIIRDLLIRDFYQEKNHNGPKRELKRICIAVFMEIVKYLTNILKLENGYENIFTSCAFREFARKKKLYLSSIFY